MIAFLETPNTLLALSLSSHTTHKTKAAHCFVPGPPLRGGGLFQVHGQNEKLSGHSCRPESCELRAAYCTVCSVQLDTQYA